MTKQDTFDTVFTHLFEQGEKARVEGGERCLYRTADGLKCAVGCLIPDGQYFHEMEDQLPISGGRSNDLSDLLSHLGHDLELCRDLQQVHDSDLWCNTIMSSVLRGLRKVAKKHHLKL